jgi:maltose alpha-D-glucosyltransferase/alpha-amylase
MKRTPLRDVAGMLRSFHYAAHSAVPDPASQQVRAMAEDWARKVAHVFLDAWLATAAGASFIPADRAALAALLEIHLIEKALYEVGYELNNRPDWVFIPVLGIAQILDEKIASRI